MKKSITLSVLVSLLLCTALFTASCGQTSGESKAGDADAFVQSLQNNGFSIQEGKLGAVDVFSMVQAGVLQNANYQNAGAAYLAPMLPAAPGQEAPCYFSDAAVETDDAGLFIDWRIQPYEAVILVGKTPPKCAYYGYDGDIATRWSEQTGTPARLFGNYGDAINPLVIKTDGPGGDPYEANTMIIMSADRGVNAGVRAAAEEAGYSPDIINDYVIPPQLLDLGLGKESDTLLLLHRFAYPEDEQAGQAYLQNPTMRVFRATPQVPPQPDLYDMPIGRVRGNGDFRELELSHTVEKLRQAILDRYGGLASQELTTAPWGADGLDAIQEMQNGYGPGRDAQYLKCGQFTLADDPNEFAIAYGINHAAIGKATYTSISVYGTVQDNGVTSAWNGMYAGTAEEYLPDDPNAQYLYVWKFARSANGDPQVTEVPFNQGIYGIDLDQPMFLGFRVYLEPETKTGPIATELYYDRVIKFSKQP
jgi:hypothetical protein